VVTTANEVGTAEPRGRPVIDRKEAEETLSGVAGETVHLPDAAVVTGRPSSCPACGSTDLMWGCDPAQDKSQDQIHPLVWHETEWMADSYICCTCHAGWIEPDDPQPITWVRPYWLVPKSR
jgi:hypothetical protein